jgi:uncharacterized protein with GYD domain
VVFLSKEEKVILPFKHIRKDKTERTFDGTVVKDGPGYKFVKPNRAFFLQLVKFVPGKGFKDYVEAYAEIDKELKKKYGKTRCEMDCHEIATFLTLGRHDMIVLWDAPDLETFQRVITAAVNPGTGFGSSETQTTLACGVHN